MKDHDRDVVRPHRVPDDKGEAAQWLAGFLEPVYARMVTIQQQREDNKRERPKAEHGEQRDSGHLPGDKSIFEPGPGKNELAEVPKDYWHRIRRDWVDRLLRHRLLREHGRFRRTDRDLPQAGVPGANNWVPIGPSVVRGFRGTGNPPDSGRVSGLAIAPGGIPVYAASADGGVWRSDDGGASWRPTMDGFDVDPTRVLSTSNCCGAVAIDPADPDRIYVGTGEGDVDEAFGKRLLTALPAYRGVGPIVSSTGGKTWSQEPTDSPATSLLGAAFFALALDPGDRERVVGATNVGLYRREPDGMGSYRWVRKRGNKHTSVIACQTGSATTFYAAEWGVGVFSSPDGDAWTAISTGFPTAGVGRITLAARPTDPSVVYAMVASGGNFMGLYRYDNGDGRWRVVSGLPALGTQADYNLPLAVDPNNVNLVFMAGSVMPSDGASIFRGAVSSSGSGSSLTYSMTTTHIGTDVHPDVHVLAHEPGNSSKLWIGCDGGVWLATTATGAATCTPKNTGLATLCCNCFAQHPTQLAVVVVGMQDNGTARYTGEEAWQMINGGDGGTPIIDWANPDNVITKDYNHTSLATDGGQSFMSFSEISGDVAPVWGAPMVTTPYNPSTPTDAGYVAFGSGSTHYGMDLYISSTFGAAWGTPVATLTQRIFALAFASSSRLYIGTTGGQVYRIDRTGANWGTPTRIDNVAGGALPLAALVTDIEIDPADTTGSSIYISFGGIGDARHVWHYDGTQWSDRSGTGGSNPLLDSSHNALVADPANPTSLYVAADIGVWQSSDSGSNWLPMQNGLPDAAVFDLQLHPTNRILRASTHGRGMFEYRIDPPAQADVELYVRDTSLDVGRAPTVDLLPDPETWPATPVKHFLSRNIKVDVPTTAGYQTPTTDIDFLQFNDTIVDGSAHTATLDPSKGTVVNRVYVEVHNRGVVEAKAVQVMLIVTRPTVGLMPLPAGYNDQIVAGKPISDANWQTVGIKTIPKLRAGFPEVVEFNLPSTMLPPPADLPARQHQCMVAFLHCTKDPYTSIGVKVDPLTIADRKVAQRNLQVVAFVGTSPASAATGQWVAVDLFGVDRSERPKDLVIDARAFKGNLRLGLLLPERLTADAVHGLGEGERHIAERWAERHDKRLREFVANGRFDPQGCRRMMADIRSTMGGWFVVSRGDDKGIYSLNGIRLEYGQRYPLFLRIDPRAMKRGTSYDLDMFLYDSELRCIEGGNTWRVVALEPTAAHREAD